jgi:hypothetical protein
MPSGSVFEFHAPAPSCALAARFDRRAVSARLEMATGCGVTESKSSIFFGDVCGMRTSKDLPVAERRFNVEQGSFSFGSQSNRFRRDAGLRGISRCVSNMTVTTERGTPFVGPPATACVPFDSS